MQQIPPQQASVGPAVSGDVRAMMMFEANKKSIVVAFLLWWFLGWAGGHRFYTNRTGSGVVQLLIFIVGAVLTIVYVGFLILFALGIWWLVDAFLIPSWIRNLNSLLAVQIAGS
jgi:TM2 domain-containing membrane protein YozV